METNLWWFLVLLTTCVVELVISTWWSPWGGLHLGSISISEYDLSLPCLVARSSAHHRSTSIRTVVHLPHTNRSCSGYWAYRQSGGGSITPVRARRVDRCYPEGPVLFSATGATQPSVLPPPPPHRIDFKTVIQGCVKTTVSCCIDRFSFDDFVKPPSALSRERRG